MKIPMGHQRNVFCDVDGTLLIWPDDAGSRSLDYADAKVNYDIVEKLRWYHGDGFVIHVWSHTSAAHALKAVELCGIKDIVEWAGAKPNFVIDDDPSLHYWHIQA